MSRLREPSIRLRELVFFYDYVNPYSDYLKSRLREPPYDYMNSCFFAITWTRITITWTRFFLSITWTPKAITWTRQTVQKDAT